MVTDRLQLLFCPGYVCLFVWKQNLCSVKKMFFVSSISIYFYLFLFSGFSYRVYAPSSLLAPSLTVGRCASWFACTHGDLDTAFLRRKHYINDPIHGIPLTIDRKNPSIKLQKKGYVWRYMMYLNLNGITTQSCWAYRFYLFWIPFL